MSKNQACEWDAEFDVVVVGSGAAGMSAGIFAALKGLDAVVLEKTAQWGGTTAMSGGVAWIPNNDQFGEVKLEDSESEAHSYLKEVVGELANPKRLEAFVKNAPKMLALLRSNSDVRYTPMPAYMDYYPDIDGFKTGGRSMEPEPVSRVSIGDEIHSVRLPANQGILNSFSVTCVEGQALAKFGNSAYWILAKRLAAYWLDLPMRLRGRADRRQTMGRSLVIRLRKSLMNLNVPLKCESAVEQLCTDHDGRVIGVVISTGGRRQKIRARKAVVLASGGFAQNAELRQKYQHDFMDPSWSASSPGDQGDAISLGLAVGAELEHMRCSWWSPTFRRPDGVTEALIAGKAMPGSIIVNKAGKRFVNEAMPYEDMTKAQLEHHEGGGEAIPAFLIADADYRFKYPIGPVGPAKAQPDVAVSAELLSDEFLVKADSLEQLAAVLGIDACGLAATVERFNEFADKGRDLDFQRGDNVHDRYYADPSVSPNPSLGPIKKGPFYALRIYPGDLSTKGGLRCDEHARVQTLDGAPIEGLYASGNCSGAVFADSYPGAGATIASALTFSYLAVEHLAQ